MRLHKHQPVETRILLRLSEAAEALGIGRNALHGLIQRGELPVVKIGRSVRVPASALEAWAERQATVAQG